MRVCQATFATSGLTSCEVATRRKCEAVREARGSMGAGGREMVPRKVTNASRTRGCEWEKGPVVEVRRR